MNDNIEEIKNNILEKYRIWSDDIPFAIVSKLKYDSEYDRIDFSFNLPPETIHQGSITVDRLDDDVVKMLQQKEIVDFIKNLKNPLHENHFETDLKNLIPTLETAYSRVFEAIGEPNVIIWSRKSYAKYVGKVGMEVKILNNKVKNVLIENQSNEIFLLIKEKFDKIYPIDERLILNVQEDPSYNIKTKFNGWIRHKVIIDNELAFARIVVN